MFSDIASKSWYDDVKHFHFAENSEQPKAKYFSQMMWKATTKVGFGIVGNFVVARYCEEVGNVDKKYWENVCPKGGCIDCSGNNEKITKEGRCETCEIFFTVTEDKKVC